MTLALPVLVSLVGFVWIAFTAMWWADAKRKKRSRIFPVLLTALGVMLQMLFWLAWWFLRWLDGAFSPKGRLLLIRGKPRMAAAEPGSGWHVPVQVEATSRIEAHLLAQAWLGMARLEHASVPAFTRLAARLTELGAPAPLIVRAYEAAVDEVEHARVCFGLAAAFAGHPFTPGELPALRHAPRRRARARAEELVALAVSSLRHGAFAEGVAARVAAASARAARDPAVRTVLERIARDEAEHARLGWDIVMFCLGEGGAEVTVAVQDSVAGLNERTAVRAWFCPRLSRLRRHGLLSREEIRALRDATACDLARALSSAATRAA